MVERVRGFLLSGLVFTNYPNAVTNSCISLQSINPNFTWASWRNRLLDASATQEVWAMSLKRPRTERQTLTLVVVEVTEPEPQSSQLGMGIVHQEPTLMNPKLAGKWLVISPKYGITIYYLIYIYIYIYTNILTSIALHYITLHYITLHYIPLHYITLHYITLQCSTSPLPSLPLPPPQNNFQKDFQGVDSVFGSYSMKPS